MPWFPHDSLFYDPRKSLRKLLVEALAEFLRETFGRIKWRKRSG